MEKERLKSEILDLKDMKDEEILALSVDRPEVFSLIFQRYYHPFLRKGRRILRHEKDAEDAVQETFVKIYMNASKFKKTEGASFKSWGYKILINSCFTSYRKTKRDGEVFAELDAEVIETMADPLNTDFEDMVNKDYLLSLISKLPNILQRVLKFQFIDGKTHKEIALKEGVSIGAVKARVHRAKKELKKFGVIPV